MARKKQEDTPPAGAPAWMSTYGDMMTLVLCFFVLLFSMSTVDAEKFQQLQQSLASTFSIEIPNSGSPAKSTYGELAGSGIAQLPNSGVGVNVSEAIKSAQSQDEAKKMASDFKTYLAENEAAQNVIVEQMEDGIKLIFTDGILFDLGRAELKAEAYPVLDIITNELLKYTENNIKIEGHTDDLPISTPRYPSNWELSSSRAITVAKYLIDVKGFSPARLSAEGFGEYRPQLPNNSEENRAKNRRVEIKIVTATMSENSTALAPVY